MKVLYLFIALTVDKHNNRSIVLTDSAIPGTVDLFAHIREFGLKAGMGRYRRLNLDIDSPTHGFHLFEHGIVKLSSVHV